MSDYEVKDKEGYRLLCDCGLNEFNAVSCTEWHISDSGFLVQDGNSMPEEVVCGDCKARYPIKEFRT